jgi:hypothetical protein
MISRKLRRRRNSSGRTGLRDPPLTFCGDCRRKAMPRSPNRKGRTGRAGKPLRMALVGPLSQAGPWARHHPRHLPNHPLPARFPPWVASWSAHRALGGPYDLPPAEPRSSCRPRRTLSALPTPRLAALFTSPSDLKTCLHTSSHQSYAPSPPPLNSPFSRHPTHPLLPVQERPPHVAASHSSRTRISRSHP